MSELVVVYVDGTRHVMGVVMHPGTLGPNPDPTLVVGTALPIRDGDGNRALMLPVAQLKLQVVDPATVDKAKLVALLVDPQGFYLKSDGTPDAAAPPPATVSATGGVVTVTLTAVSSPPQQLLCAIQDLAFPADASATQISTFDPTTKKATVTGSFTPGQLVLVLVSGLRPMTLKST
jgi:hypothetical protein